MPSFRTALFSAAVGVTSLVAASAASADTTHNATTHVLLISIDGMHASDLTY